MTIHKKAMREKVCSKCGEGVPEKPRHYKKVKGKRVRVSGCCKAKVVRDLSSPCFVKEAQKTLEELVGKNAHRCKDLRFTMVPLHKLRKKDLLYLLYWILEIKLRKSPSLGSIQTILGVVGEAGTKIPLARAVTTLIYELEDSDTCRDVIEQSATRVTQPRGSNSSKLAVKKEKSRK